MHFICPSSPVYVSEKSLQHYVAKHIKVTHVASYPAPFWQTLPVEITFPPQFSMKSGLYFKLAAGTGKNHCRGCASGRFVSKSLAYAKEVLGHSSFQTTERWYVAPLPEKAIEVARRIG